MALDASLAEAYAAAGFQLSTQGGKGIEAIAQFQKAIQIDPNYSVAYNWMGLQYRNLGPAYLQETFAAIEKAAQLDPLSSRALAMYTNELAHRNCFAEADIELEKLATIDPLGYARTRGYCLGLRGRAAENLLSLLDAGLIAPRESFENRGGDYAHLRESWEEYWQEDSDNWSANEMATLIAMRRHAGKDNDVSDLLAAMKKRAQQNHDEGIAMKGVADYEYGLATFLEGDQDKGIEWIGKAVGNGFFIWPNEAYLQILYDHPGYAPILAKHKAWQKRERNKFLAVICNDNPYAAVWQPEEGTCEQFAAVCDIQ